MLTFSALIGRGSIGFVGKTGATPGDKPDESIDGFPEFAFTMDTIKDPLVKGKLKSLARKIVASHETGPNRIIGFEVHGHADQTTRFSSEKERESTELEISIDRAENAKLMLLQTIEEEGGKPIISGIKANTVAKAFGSKHRIFKPATTEAQMRKNRRVEIFLKEFVNPPPSPSPPPDPPKPEVRTKFRIQIKSGTVVFVSTPVPGTSLTVRISLKVVIFDIDQNQQATFNAVAIGKALPPIGIIPPQPIEIINVREGLPTEFNAQEGVTLQNFDGDMTIAMNPGIPALGIGSKFSMFFDALRGRTRPNPVEVKGGSALEIPKFVIAITPTSGKLSMEGRPTR